MNCGPGLTFLVLLALELVIYCLLTPHRDLLRDSFGSRGAFNHLAVTKGKARDPEASNPFSYAWDNSVALCAIARSEATADVREWLQYYRFIGVDHVFLYDNSGDGGAQAPQFHDFIDHGFLTWILVSGKAKQVGSYQHCAKHYAKGYSWLITVDIDEYIVVTDHVAQRTPHRLKEILKDFRFYPGLWIQWRVFGSSGHTHRPRVGGALINYMKCVVGGAIDMYGKSVANMFWFKAVSNAHASFYRGDGMHVSDVLEPLPQVFDEVTQTFTRASSRMPPRLELSRNPRRGTRAVVHHYATKSLEDFTAKLQRGTADKSSGISIRHQEWFDSIQRIEVAAPRCLNGVHIGQMCCYRYGKPWPPVPSTFRQPPHLVDAEGVEASKEQHDAPPTVFWESHVHPFSAAWLPTVTLCSQIHPDTNPSGLLAWIQYHRHVGVDAVVLVAVRHEEVDASQWDAMQQIALQLPAGAAQAVEVEVGSAAEASAAVYQRCRALATNETSWLAFVEVEDFIVPRESKSTKPLSTLLRETRFRYRPGVVAPVFRFDPRCITSGSCPDGSAEDELPPDTPQWFRSCLEFGHHDVRTIGNMYWLDAPRDGSLPRFRGDLLPVTGAGKVYVDIAQDWFPNLTHPIMWNYSHDLLRRYSPPTAFDKRLAIFSFPRGVDFSAMVNVSAASSLPLSACGNARSRSLDTSMDATDTQTNTYTAWFWH